MVATAKLFKNGQSQAIRLPKEFRFEGASEVWIKKVDDTVIIMGKKSDEIWKKMFESLENFSDDFLQERMQPDQKREELFS